MNYNLSLDSSFLAAIADEECISRRVTPGRLHK